MLYSRIADHPEILKQALLAYFEIGTIRNSINHSNAAELGIEESTDDTNPILDMVKRGIQEVIDSFNACYALLGEHPEDFTFPKITWPELQEYIRMKEEEEKANPEAVS